jgi:virginiamycin B lyase
MTRFPARAASLVALALGGAIVAGAVAWSFRSGQSARFVEYKAEAMDVPTAITVGADGTVWFTMDLSAAIGRVRDGHLERLPTPGPGLEPLGLGAAADGGVWYTDNAAHAVAHMSRDGVVSRFGLETPSVQLARLTVAPDGAAWFAEPTGYSVTRLKDGAFTRHVFSSSRGAPYGVAVAPDGTVWATLQGGNQLLHVTSAGEIDAVDVPRPGALPSDIAVGPDGSVWFIEFHADRIAHYSNGRFEEFDVGEQGAALSGLAVAPDGTVWFAMLRAGGLGRLRAGKVERFRIPRDHARPFSVALDRAGNVWYADIGGYVGRLETASLRR